MIQCFAAILKCEVMVTPFLYLGLSVGRSHKRRAFWDGVVVRMKKRLSRWKGRFLSLTGRICLINSTLSTIPLFYLSLLKMSVVVANELVKTQRNFLWRWGSNGRKVAWASWKKVCAAREIGGHGIIDLRTFNLALLGKWVWWLGSDKSGLWKEILDSMYGGWRSLREGGKDNNDSLWWKDLREVCSLEGWGRNFEEALIWKVGIGKEILFWEENWVGIGALKMIFLRLYSLDVSKASAMTTFGG